MDYNKLDKCVICSSKNLSEFINLGEQPLANSFLINKDDEENKYPLAVNFCNDCGHTQLSISIKPEILFKDYNYITGTSKSINDYFSWFVKYVEGRSNKDKLNVLEIASNDGTLLKHFLDKEHKVLGIDPASNLKPLAAEKEVEQLDIFWNKDAVECFSDNRTFDCIVAQNVLAHVPEPVEFMLACKEVLAEDGKIYVQTSQAEMYKRNEFDTIYHEHLSFFTIRSFIKLGELIGLNITDILKMDIHGSSYLIEYSYGPPHKGRINYCLEDELGMDNIGYFNSFRYNASKIIHETKSITEEYKKEGYTICGFGAAAKGNTFINCSEIELDFVVDDTPTKVNKFYPGCRVPIVSRDELIKHDKLLIIILPWNFASVIERELYKLGKENRNEISVLTYFPSVNAKVLT